MVPFLKTCNFNIHRQKTLKRQQKYWDAWEVAGQAFLQHLLVVREGGGRGGAEEEGTYDLWLTQSCWKVVWTEWNGKVMGSGRKPLWWCAGCSSTAQGDIFSFLWQNLVRWLRQRILMLGGSQQNSQSMYKCIPGSLCHPWGAERWITGKNNVLFLQLDSQL